MELTAVVMTASDDDGGDGAAERGCAVRVRLPHCTVQGMAHACVPLCFLASRSACVHSLQ